MSEIAFACVLLVGAGLLIRSFVRVLDVDIGLPSRRAPTTMRVDPDARVHHPAQQRIAYFDEVLRRVSARLPGIEAPASPTRCRSAATAPGARAPRASPTSAASIPIAFVRIVSDGYLAAMGIPLRAGRDFAEQRHAGRASR